jgi:hypothetical protein
MGLWRGVQEEKSPTVAKFSAPLTGRAKHVTLPERKAGRVAAADQLSDFVRHAMAGGHDAASIRAALGQAGWTASEIDQALTAWHPGGSLPPVPRPRAYVSAREAMLYALLMIALVLVCFHVLRLGFQVIDGAIPDLAQSGARDSWSMRFSIAALIAFLPLFVLLDGRMARRSPRGQPQRRSQARRVFASVTVLVAALVLLGDVVAAVYAFLSGDLTLRLAAKLALVALTGLLVAACYREDLDG